MEELLTVQEVAARTGLSVHALRYYERVGLIDPVSRATSGHRRYSADDLSWISFLLHLRTTGMTIRQMQAFADLRRQGDTTEYTRLAFLEAHQRQVREHVRELESHLAVIEEKLHHYRSTLADKAKAAERNQRLVVSRSAIVIEEEEDEVPAFT